jgi:hypothetical protein
MTSLYQKILSNTVGVNPAAVYALCSCLKDATGVAFVGGVNRSGETTCVYFAPSVDLTPSEFVFLLQKNSSIFDYLKGFSQTTGVRAKIVRKWPDWVSSVIPIDYDKLK